MYHDDISSTVIILRQFDQSVPAHIIKVPREDLEIQVFKFFFANRNNSSKNIQLSTLLLDIIPVISYELKTKNKNAQPGGERLNR